MKNKLRIHKFTIGVFAVNNYLVYPENSKQAILIDAGENPVPILKKIDDLDLQLIYLINTHGHGDHIAGNEKILSETGAKLLIHETDAPFLENPELNLSAYLGFELRSPKPAKLLHANDKITLGQFTFSVIHTPGHTPGHITLLCDRHAFVGDVIFQNGIGRTDLPRGSGHTLFRTIRQKIYTLPEETVLYPGHGPNTTVKNEKYHNPFVSM